MKKRGRQTGKERFTIHASLCGGGDLLKALSSVASYLADRLFNLSNDNMGKDMEKIIERCCDTWKVCRSCFFEHQFCYFRLFLLRLLWRVNSDALLIAFGQNIKRPLKQRGWGRRPCPAEAVFALFLAAYWWFTRLFSQ